MTKNEWTIGGIRAANKLAGKIFFSREAVLFFRSKIVSRVYQGDGGVFFVTAEEAPAPEGARETVRFTLRQFLPSTGDVLTAGSFQQYQFVQDAKAAAAILSAGGVDMQRRGVIQ